LGQIISANQILRLIELADTARSETRVRDLLLPELPECETLRKRMSGTRFLEELDSYFSEYGHRAVGESDVMVPRFAERPEYVLGIIRAHLLAGPARSVETIRREQETARQAALNTIKTAFGWRLHEWAWFCWWRRRLHTYLALREANRHYLMLYSTGVRRILLVLGEKLTVRGVVERPDDVFFFTDEELRSAVTDPQREWKRVVAARRAEQKAHAAQPAPDTIVAQAGGIQIPVSDEPEQNSGVLKGLPISAGYVEGPVRRVLAPADYQNIKNGDVLVVPVIDPGMAPLLTLASGLIADMGGRP
jgi:pyruvate,water dikinase